MAFSAHDVVPDSQTNNFATWNPLVYRYSVGNATNFTNGNLTAIGVSTTGADYSIGTLMIEVDTYIEVYVNQVSIFALWIGLRSVESTQTTATSEDIRYSSDSRQVLYDGRFVNNYGSTYGAGDIIGIHASVSNGQVQFYKNGTALGVVTYDPTGLSLSVILTKYSSTPTIVTANFGQDPTFGGAKSPTTTYTDARGIGSFYYQPPSGALALCTANLPDPDIDPAEDDVPEDYFKAVAYTGRSTAGDYQVVTGMQPDLVWIKSRNVGHNHYVVDSVNGVNSYLSTNNTNPTSSNTPIEFTSFNTDGFTAKFTTGGGRTAYSSDGPFVAWTWKAGGAPANNQALIVDTDGTLITKTTADLRTETGASVTPSKVSANRKSGFSIIRYPNGVSVPHGLSKAPEFFITKSVGSTSSWVGYHKDATPANNQYIVLNSSNGVYASGQNVRGFAPTNFVFSNFNSGNLFGGMGANADMIAYCWHSVAGYSAFGSYTGNGSADGPFVYTGFRPAWVMIKSSSAVSNWTIYDTVRDTDNPEEKVLYLNTTNSESTAGLDLDIVSNGFKFREAGGQGNDNGSPTYIYAAFAEQTFKYSNAR